MCLQEAGVQAKGSCPGSARGPPEQRAAACHTALSTRSGLDTLSAGEKRDSACVDRGSEARATSPGGGGLTAGPRAPRASVSLPGSAGLSHPVPCDWRGPPGLDRPPVIIPGSQVDLRGGCTQTRQTPHPPTELLLETKAR